MRKKQVVYKVLKGGSIDWYLFSTAILLTPHLFWKLATELMQLSAAMWLKSWPGGYVNAFMTYCTDLKAVLVVALFISLFLLAETGCDALTSWSMRGNRMLKMAEWWSSLSPDIMEHHTRSPVLPVSLCTCFLHEKSFSCV